MSKSVQIPARPETVEIDPQKTAVVVVDMQNAFFEGGVFDRASSFIDSLGAEWDFSEARKTIDPILSINASARRHGMPVIYVVMRYAADLSDAGGPTSPNWYRESIRHYHKHPDWRDSLPISGTWGGEIIKEMEPEEGDIIVEKIRYSGFRNTNLDAVLRTHDIRHVVFTGIATNVCVEDTLKGAFYHEYFPILISDATYAYGPPYMQEASEFTVESLYGSVTTSSAFVESLTAADTAADIAENKNSVGAIS